MTTSARKRKWTSSGNNVYRLAASPG